MPGVDVLFIGPFDLGINIGHPVLEAGKMDPELVNANQSIHKVEKANGKGAGIFCDTGEGESICYARVPGDERNN